MKRTSSSKLSAEARITLINHGFYQFGNALSVIFINLYLWRLTNDLWINGAYNLISFLIVPLASLIVGKIAKQKDRLLVYRYGIFLTAAFYLLILIAQERMVDFYVFFALLKGVSNAFYWLGHFTIVYDVSNNENRHRYLGWNQIFTNIATLAGPPLAGFIIVMNEGLRGYTILFLLSTAMFIVASLISLRMKPSPMHRKRYYIRYTIAIARKYKAFRYTLFGWTIFGLPQGIMAYIPQILLYQVIPSESFVGNINIFFVTLTTISSYLLARKAKTEDTRTYLTITAIGLTVSSGVLLFGSTFWPVVIFMSIYSFIKPVQANSYTAHFYKMIDELPMRGHFSIESIVIRESVVNVGRSIGILVFMFAAQSLHAGWMPWILFVVMAMQLTLHRFIISTKPSKGGNSNGTDWKMGGSRAGS